MSEFKCLHDKIFYGLPSLERVAWHMALESAIPTNLPEAVFTRFQERFLHDLLKEKVLPLVPEEHVSLRDAISDVVSLFQRSLAGKVISFHEWAVVARAVGGVAWGSADSAAWAADSAAQAVNHDCRAPETHAAAFAAVHAAEAVALAAADDAQAAVDAFWRWAAERLLALIREEVAAWEAAGKPG